MNSNELQLRLKNFAYRIVKLCEALPPGRISKIIEDQLLRASFSAAANYRSSCKAISRKAFVAKLSIAFEEADETLFWLEAIQEIPLLPENKMTAIIQEAKELSSILAASRKTSQSKIAPNLKS